MSQQGKVQIRTGSPLVSGIVTNVATNEADIALMKEMAGNVTGKSINPSEVFAKRASFDEALVVDGGSIYLGDGIVAARNLLKGQLLIVEKAQIGDAIIDGSHLDLGPNGELSALSANLGTMTTGQLSVGSGGVVIGSVTAGVSIAANVIKCVKSSVVTVLIDGDTGILTCSKVNMTTDSNSSIDLNSGQHYLGTSIVIGPPGTQRTVDNMARVFPPSANAPTTGMSEGDLWLDANNKPYRYNGSSWVAVQDAAIGTAQSTAESKNKTFYQSGTPTALAVGDLWVDTGNNNKLYRASSAGTGGWVEVTDARVADAIQNSSYVTLNANNQITNIDLNGITIGTAASGQRVQLNNTGVGCYNSSGTLKTFMDIYGFHCRRGSSTVPAVVERMSFETSDGGEYGFVCGHKDANGGLIVAGYSGKLHLFSGLYDNSGNWGWYDYDMEAYAGGEIVLMPGAGGGDKVVSVGTTTYNDRTLRLHSEIEFGVDGPTITYGSGEPSASEPNGSLYLSTGGSIWLRYSGAWKRIWHDGVQSGTVAHTH